MSTLVPRASAVGSVADGSTLQADCGQYSYNGALQPYFGGRCVYAFKDANNKPVSLDFGRVKVATLTATKAVLAYYDSFAFYKKPGDIIRVELTQQDDSSWVADMAVYQYPAGATSDPATWFTTPYPGTSHSGPFSGIVDLTP